MSTTRTRPRALRALTPLAALAILLSVAFVLVPAADHRDGPIFGPPGLTITRSRRDINDIYIFRSPANANNTVLILTMSPFTTATTPAIFDHRVTVDFHVINRNLIQATDDITLRVNFSPPNAHGVQDVVLRGFPASHFNPPSLVSPTPNPILAQGKTGQNLPVRGGGAFRAAEQDDPFFFDAVAFGQLLNGQPYPRPVGTAANFFGPNVNTLAIIIEIPSKKLKLPASNLIGFWASTSFQGVQLDRMGRPAINTALIPPIPRGATFPIGGTMARNRQERRNAFNAGHPKNDRRDFRADMISVLQAFYGRTAADANAISGLLLPDILIHDVTSADGFGNFLAGGTLLGNGRRLRDDVIDVEVTVLTNGVVTTDNVGDDNGARITNRFPYIGARNLNPTALPGAPPPP